MACGVALVTGASHGIGRAIALRLAADGYDIALNDLQAEKVNLHCVTEEIIKLGRKVLECLDDITNEDAIIHVIERVEEELGGIDVMVANAGICIPRPFLESTSEDWDRTFNVNAKGVYLCYKYAAKQMVKQGRGGRIIGACSLAGKRGSPLLSIYGATKFAVRSLTESAAIELEKYGITVNAYAPGFVKTPLLDQYIQDTKKWGVTDELYQSAVEAEEVAALVSYLASKDAKHITGQSVSSTTNGHRPDFLCCAGADKHQCA